jgi:NADPH-dependent glutamate synthase beta subunit-like oxidoreductase
VLVVGAGPSGLSGAYHLTRLGYAVTIKDAGAEPGGLCVAECPCGAIEMEPEQA